jgi:hypothetical protein
MSVINLQNVPPSGVARPTVPETAPRDGTQIRFWCRSETAPILDDYWSRSFIGWVALPWAHAADRP